MMTRVENEPGKPFMIEYMGLRIVQNYALTEQYRFPKSRGKRIRKKWRQRSENFRPMRKAILMAGGIVVVHPKAYDGLLRTIRASR